jgi:hypothetical protein
MRARSTQSSNTKTSRAISVACSRLTSPSTNELLGQAQKEFVTAVQRLSRTLWPDTRLKVKLLPSHTSVLVQAADVVAYNFPRFVRNHLKTSCDNACLYCKGKSTTSFWKPEDGTTK